MQECEDISDCYHFIYYTPISYLLYTTTDSAVFAIKGLWYPLFKINLCSYKADIFKIKLPVLYNIMFIVPR